MTRRYYERYYEFAARWRMAIAFTSRTCEDLRGGKP